MKELIYCQDCGWRGEEKECFVGGEHITHYYICPKCEGTKLEPNEFSRSEVMEEIIPKYRTRINVSTSVKGIKTWDCTVEEISDNIPATQRDIILSASDALVKELEKRYPANIEGGK